MPSLPFRRKSKLASAAKTARNLAFARAAVALVQTKVRGRVPGLKPKRTVTPGRAAIAGGVVAGIAGLVRSRRGGSGGSGGGGGGTSVPSGPVPPPAPANYDAPGPPANTATPVPVVDEPLIDGAIDEEAEIAAAAAEAANIGGGATEYPSSEPSLLADDAEAPLIEAGEGEAEGQELTEAELLDNVTDPYGPGAGMGDAERQIEQAIADADNPLAGEHIDPAAPPGGEESGPVT